MAQAILDFPAQPADEAVAFELGRDFARHALAPPPEHLAAGSPLHHGWVAGRASFGARTLAPTPHVRQWLQLRLSAWRCGRAFEGMLVTPNYLRQIDVAWCPITRRALTRQAGGVSDASVARVRDDAGYAAGNLAVISSQASAAKDGCSFDGALAMMRLAEACPAPAAGDAVRPELGGLGAADWARVAVLCSFVTALPHEQAAGLPLLLLPPNRLRMFNPVQALQALLTRQFGLRGSERSIGSHRGIASRQGAAARLPSLRERAAAARARARPPPRRAGDALGTGRCLARSAGAALLVATRAPVDRGAGRTDRAACQRAQLGWATGTASHARSGDRGMGTGAPRLPDGAGRTPRISGASAAASILPAAVGSAQRTDSTRPLRLSASRAAPPSAAPLGSVRRARRRAEGRTRGPHLPGGIGRAMF